MQGLKNKKKTLRTGTPSLAHENTRVNSMCIYVTRTQAYVQAKTHCSLWTEIVIREELLTSKFTVETGILMVSGCCRLSMGRDYAVVVRFVAGKAFNSPYRVCAEGGSAGWGASVYSRWRFDRRRRRWTLVNEIRVADYRVSRSFWRWAGEERRFIINVKSILRFILKFTQIHK